MQHFSRLRNEAGIMWQVCPTASTENDLSATLAIQATLGGHTIANMISVNP